MKLDGNTVLITGGSSGIGFELAKQLKARNNTLIITGRDAAKLQRAADQLPGIHCITSDVRKAEDVEALYQRIVHDFPSLNMLINNAGVMRVRNLNTDAPDDLAPEIETNLIGPIQLTRRFLTLLKSKPSSAIITISSSLAYVPLAVLPVYCATKAAMHSFCLSLREQLKRSTVRVVEVLPPTTRTDMLTAFSADDLAGLQMMSAEDLVKATLEGLARDKLEIRPGQAGQLRFMSRLAPDFIFAQLSKSVAKMLE